MEARSLCKYAIFLAALAISIASPQAFAAPSAPSNLAATAFSTTRADLTWNDNSGNETSFQLERAPNVNNAPGTFARIATLGANVHAYSDSALGYGTRYWYRVRAVNNSGNSAYSSNVSVTTLTAVSLAVSGYPASVTAGAGAQVTVSARDSKGNAATGYPGTIQLTSSDATATLPANSTLPGATASFTVVLKAAGSQSITARDTVTASLTGTQGAIVVSPANAARFALVYPASVVAGNLASLTVTAYDAFNNIATGYRGTVTFSSTSANAALPAAYAFVAGDGGSRSFTAALNTAGVQAITAQDGGLSGTRSAISVGPANATRLAVSFPTSVVAGANTMVAVAAYDAYGNLATGYRGSIAFTSSSSFAQLPPQYNFIASDAGSMTSYAWLGNAGVRSLTAQDIADPTITGTQAGINVAAANASRLTVAFPASVQAGSPASLDVVAYDPYGNVATGYLGTIAFATSSASAAMPAQYTFVAGDAGARSFSAALNTAGFQSVGVQDTVNATLSASKGGITVVALGAARLAAAYPSAVVAGSFASLVVTAYDPYGNVATGYRGNVAISSTSTSALIPAPYTFAANDMGTRTFNVALNTAGVKAITVQDTGNASVAATQSGITVSAADAARFTLSFPSSVVAGVSTALGISAYDTYGNAATGYRGTVSFSSTSANATLPPPYTFSAADAGVKTLAASLNTTGVKSLTAQDTANASISATQASITVSAAGAASFALAFPSSVTAGSPASLGVTAYDAFGNVATGYLGTVSFSTTSASAALPPPYTFVAGDAGVHSFSASLNSPGVNSLSAQDTANASVNGTQGPINVAAADAARLVVTFPSAVVAGTPATLGITAYDAFGNVVTGYRGTVAFTSTSANAALPAQYTFGAGDAGTHSFSATLNSAGVRSISAQDTGNASVNGTQGAITVSAADAARFAVTFPATVTAGTSAALAITAQDAFGNVATGYRGTVGFTTTSANATLPPEYTFAAGDSGAHSFSASLNTIGVKSITAQDTVNASVTGTLASITVNAGDAARLAITFPSAVTAGTSSALGVTVYDAYNNIATGYRGRIAFSSTSTNAILPAQFTFAAGDAGTHAFTASLNTAGTQGITVQDTVNASLTATQTPVTVSAGDAARFTLAFPTSVVAGTPASLGVSASDAFGNPAAGYAGTVAFTSTSANASLPAQYTFAAEDGGTKSFTASLNTAGVKSITATDVQNAAVKATLGGITVAAGPASQLSVQGYPSLITAGETAAVTVKATDGFGNLAAGYAGTVHFGSTDAQALMPLDSALAGGTGRFTAKFRTAGIQSITAQDAATATLSGAQTGITVNAAPPACVGGVWKLIGSGQLVHAGPGLREPTAGITYGGWPGPNGIVLPKCSYFQGLIRLPVFLVDWADFNPATDNANPNNPSSVGLPGYVKSTPAEVDYFANGPTGAAQYFRDVSGGRADMEFDVFGWITSSTPGSYLKNRADYITMGPNSSYQCDLRGIFKDTLRNAVAFHGLNLANYDSDGNTIMDGSILLYEGGGALCNGGNLYYLSGQAGLGTPPTVDYQDARKLVPATDPNAALFANQNVYIEYWNNIPERTSGTVFYPVATWAHELGHLLFGYPDYYYPQFNLASWALSAGHGSVPTHPAAFEKWMFVHWLEPVVAQSSGTYTLAANEIPDGSVYDGNTYLYQVPIDGDPKRFITIENRWFDAEGNTGTQWAGANSRESGLMIMEFNLGVDNFSTNPPQIYRNVPARATPFQDWRAYRPGDTFSKCYTTMCVTIDQIGAPGQQVQFTLTVTPK